MQLQTRPSSSRGATKEAKDKRNYLLQKFRADGGGGRGGTRFFFLTTSIKTRQKLDSDQWPHAVTYFLNPTHTLSSSTHK